MALLSFDRQNEIRTAQSVCLGHFVVPVISKGLEVSNQTPCQESAISPCLSVALSARRLDRHRKEGCWLHSRYLFQPYRMKEAFLMTSTNAVIPKAMGFLCSLCMSVLKQSHRLTTLQVFSLCSKSPCISRYLFLHYHWQCWSVPRAGLFEVAIQPFRNYSHLIDPVGRSNWESMKRL